MTEDIQILKLKSIKEKIIKHYPLANTLATVKKGEMNLRKQITSEIKEFLQIGDVSEVDKLEFSFKDHASDSIVNFNVEINKEKVEIEFDYLDDAGVLFRVTSNLKFKKTLSLDQEQLEEHWALYTDEEREAIKEKTAYSLIKAKYDKLLEDAKEDPESSYVLFDAVTEKDAAPELKHSFIPL